MKSLASFGRWMSLVGFGAANAHVATLARATQVNPDGNLHAGLMSEDLPSLHPRPLP